MSLPKVYALSTGGINISMETHQTEEIIRKENRYLLKWKREENMFTLYIVLLKEEKQKSSSQNVFNYSISVAGQNSGGKARSG